MNVKENRRKMKAAEKETGEKKTKEEENSKMDMKIKLLPVCCGHPSDVQRTVALRNGLLSRNLGLERVFVICSI
jgi:hypothetical protein